MFPTTRISLNSNQRINNKKIISGTRIMLYCHFGNQSIRKLIVNSEIRNGLQQFFMKI